MGLSKQTLILTFSSSFPFLPYILHSIPSFSFSSPPPSSFPVLFFLTPYTSLPFPYFLFPFLLIFVFISSHSLSFPFLSSSFLYLCPLLFCALFMFLCFPFLTPSFSTPLFPSPFLSFPVLSSSFLYPCPLLFSHTISVPLVSFSYSFLLFSSLPLSTHFLSVPSLSSPPLSILFSSFFLPSPTYLVPFPFLSSHFLSSFLPPVIAHGGMPESRPPSLTLSLSWPPAGQHCCHTAVQLCGVVSIHTYSAIKLEKRELAGREVDA